jgi:hypothetical protein
MEFWNDSYLSELLGCRVLNDPYGVSLGKELPSGQKDLQDAHTLILVQEIKNHLRRHFAFAVQVRAGKGITVAAFQVAMVGSRRMERHYP